MIPGGTQLLSKRPEMFLPDYWPSYYKKANAVQIWDLDDNKYIDMSIMGIGTCSLGYSNKAVNKAVKKSIDNGSFSTLNSFDKISRKVNITTSIYGYGSIYSFRRKQTLWQ